MAKTPRTKRTTTGTRRRATDAITGLINSGVRTLQNAYFLGVTACYVYAWKNEALLTKIIAFVSAKISKALGDWMTSHKGKSLGIMYAVLVMFLAAPTRTSTAAAIITAAVVYYTSAVDRTNWYTYVVLVFGVLWYVRTASRKIKAGIVFLFFAAYFGGLWGVDLFG